MMGLVRVSFRILADVLLMLVPGRRCNVSRPFEVKHRLGNFPSKGKWLRMEEARILEGSAVHTGVSSNSAERPGKVSNIE